MRRQQVVGDARFALEFGDLLAQRFDLGFGLGGLGLFRQGALTSLMNPKAYLFMLAVFPQFLRPESGPLWRQALVMLLEVEKTLVEGAGAVGLAALLKYPERFKGKRVGLVLCGGNIDPLLLAAIIERGMVRAGRLARIRVGARDVPGSLARITATVADAGANIEEVHHQRAFTTLSAQNAEVEEGTTAIAENDNHYDNYSLGDDGTSENDGSAERAAETVTDLERPVQDQPVQDQPRGIPSDNLPPSFAPTVNRKGQRPSIKSVVLPNVAANAAGAAAGIAAGNNAQP